MLQRAPTSPLPFVLLGGWFALALAAGASGRVASVRSPAPQLVLAGLTLAALAAVTWAATVRDWVNGLDVRALVALHLTRFVGIYFLLDILLVVATAARLLRSDPDSMQAMLRLPLSLLPTFLVPLIITSHLVLLRRLR